jgi:hypothetical protein
MDSWEGIGPDHFYTTGTTYHRWSSERSRFWGLTGIPNRFLARLRHPAWSTSGQLSQYSPSTPD